MTNYKTEYAIRLGQAIKINRTEIGISSAELARRTGIGKGYVSRLENGFHPPNIDMLCRIAKALEVPPSRLMIVAESLDATTVN